MKWDFLKILFDDHLNSEGELVTISGYEYKRNEILEGLDPIAYDEVFDNWLAERQQQLLIKAQNILEFEDNFDCYAQLLAAYKKGNLIPFIGAGISKSSDYPTWTEFLYGCCAKSHVSVQRIDELLNDGLYEQAAQELYEDMTPPLFNKRLSQTYGAQKEPSGPIWYIPSMFGHKHILTTNFDTLLERVFSEVGGAVYQIKSGCDLPEILSMISSTPNLLIKLHGTWEHLNSRVLLEEEYENKYSDSGTVNHFFDRCIFRDSLVFIGASLTVDRTVLKMREIAEHKGHHTLPDHYAFLEKKSDSNLIERGKELAQANIFPIWYPEGEHDESIEALFYKMIKDCE